MLTSNRAALAAFILLSFITGCLLVPGQAHAQMGQSIQRYPVVVVGDSLAAGVGSHDPSRQSWPARIGVYNMALGGSCLITPGCGNPVTLSESFDSVLGLHPNEVLVSIGRNDLCHMPTADLIGAYKALRSRATDAGVYLRFATITPAGRAWQWPCEEQRAEVNDWLRTLPGTMDFERVTITPHGALRSKFDSGDGLHLNAHGYARLARLVLS